MITLFSFLLQRERVFYKRLKDKCFLALTGMKGEDTMHSIAISIRGSVREIGSEMIPHLFDNNPYMHDIFPKIEARRALTVFEIYKGEGEWFDLSKAPIERFSFFFGGEKERESGYFVSSFCSSCGLCVSICPQKAIEIRDKASIHQENSLRCGSCLSICPMNAIKRS